MNNTIDLNPEHRAIVLSILREHLPTHAKVWVFGSRATGKARRVSDLDLAIDLEQPLPFDTEMALDTAFEDSDLPWTVDIVDMQSIKNGFRENVERDKICLTWQPRKQSLESK